MIIILFIVIALLLAGCNRKESVEATNKLVSITIPATSIAESTITHEESTVFSRNTSTCSKQFTRRQVSQDGSVKEYCLPPEYFKLKSCKTYKDCRESEDCINGYCLIFEEDVIKKIEGAFCEAGKVEDNGVLAFLKYVIFAIKKDNKETFVLERDKKFGGSVVYKKYEDLEREYVAGKIHPSDLKKNLAREINLLLRLFRKKRSELIKLAEEAYS